MRFISQAGETRLAATLLLPRDEVIVRTHLKNVRESIIHFGYELVRASDGEVLAEGETTHMILDAKMKTASLPASILKVFREAAGK